MTFIVKNVLVNKKFCPECKEEVEYEHCFHCGFGQKIIPLDVEHYEMDGNHYWGLDINGYSDPVYSNRPRHRFTVMSLTPNTKETAYELKRRIEEIGGVEGFVHTIRKESNRSSDSRFLSDRLRIIQDGKGFRVSEYDWGKYEFHL